MTRRAEPSRAAFHRAGLALALSACTAPATQLVVVMDSDLDPADRGCVLLEARPLDASEVTASTPLEGPSVPFSFGVTPPGGDPARNVEIAVSAYATCGQAATPGAVPIVSRRVRTGFIRGTTLRLDVFLSRLCAGVDCGADQTCDPASGACVDIGFVDPQTLATVRPGDELDRDGATPAADAGTDASDSVPPFDEPTAPAVVVEPPGSTGGEESLFVWDVATDASGDAFFAKGPPFRVRRIGADASLRWERAWTGTIEAHVARRIGDALYLCGELSSNVTPDGAPVLAYPTTHGAFGSAVFVARLDPTDGAYVWGAVVSTDAAGGSDVSMSCGGLAGTSDGIAIAFGATAAPGAILIDGAAVPSAMTVGHQTSGQATAFVLHLSDDGVAPAPRRLRAIRGVAELNTEFTLLSSRSQIGVVEDAEGGVLVAARGVGPISGLADAESLGTGSATTLAVARYDASGAPLWIQRDVSLSGAAGAFVPVVVRAGDRVLAFATVFPESAGSTVVSGVPGLDAATATFDAAGLFAVAIDASDGSIDGASFRRTAHPGRLTEALLQPSGEVMIGGYALGDRTAATPTTIDTFGAVWQVPDLDAGFVALLDSVTFETVWLLDIQGEAVAEDMFVGGTEWERTTGMDVGPGGETWIGGKLRSILPGNTVLGTPSGSVGYLSRLR